MSALAKIKSNYKKFSIQLLSSYLAIPGAYCLILLEFRVEELSKIATSSFVTFSVNEYEVDEYAGGRQFQVLA
ncbi:hypothetical protein [Leptolyngbya sp. Cla-17]|uniref:hypothetical protein n=1 Tax=Leptolyngbya sp. Cla-17 TaxID=2803751 RepID=UPI001A92C654|nr:hypothetical protein [Leptolyngbya sp. Cla-17]